MTEERLENAPTRLDMLIAFFLVCGVGSGGKNNNVAAKVSRGSALFLASQLLTSRCHGPLIRHSYLELVLEGSSPRGLFSWKS